MVKSEGHAARCFPTESCRPGTHGPFDHRPHRPSVGPSPRKLAGVVSDGARGEVWRAVALQAGKSERKNQGEEILKQLKGWICWVVLEFLRTL